MKKHKIAAVARIFGPRHDPCLRGTVIDGKIALLKRVILPGLVLVALFSGALNVQAQSIYHVRAGATGANNGSDWNNAYTDLPSSLVRGATYYIADGSYGSKTLSTANSGSAYITIKKATSTSHGTDTGWSSAYGDGQAVFGSITLTTDYWVIDGTARNESSWNTPGSYGFRATEFYSNALSYGHCADNVTIKYVEVGGTYSESYNGGDRSFYLGGFSESCDNWTISRNFIHNTFEIQLAGANNAVIEYNWFGPTWGKEVIRGQVRATNITARFNVFRNACRDDHDPGSGCTGEIMLFGNQGDTPNFEGLKIYGNIVWKTIGQHKTDGTFGAEANDCKIHNNTIYDNGSGTSKLTCFSSASSAIQNNIWYLTGGQNAGTIAGTANNNSTYTSNPPFVSVAGGNFHLTGPLVGGSLSSPYNIDMDGKTRGSDGVWDRGAYEYGGGNPPPDTQPPNPPGTLGIMTQ